MPESLPLKPDTTIKNIALSDIIDLRDKGLTIKQTAALLKCSESNIKFRLKDIKTKFASLETYKKVQTDILRLKVKDMVTALTSDVIKKMPGRDLITGAAILIDKIRLLEGESTENISFRGYMERYTSIEEQKQAISERLAELKHQAGLEVITTE